METIEQLRRRLDIVEDLGAIVRTMKALAAVSTRQYERAVLSLNDYYRAVDLGIRIALRDMPPPADSFHGDRMQPAAVVFGSDYGLCGRFNEEIADYARERLREAASDSKPPRLIAVGARVANQLAAAGYPIDTIMLVPGSAARITVTVRQVLLKIEEWRSESRGERVYLIHNRPLKPSGSYPTGIQLLPVKIERFQRSGEGPWPSRTLPTFTMERGRLVATLLRQYFFVSLFRACAESLAAENASRLAAMQAAEKNLSERKEELLGEFRRQRQDAITAELLDVVSGYEALAENTMC